jgi:hypothetical protein
MDNAERARRWMNEWVWRWHSIDAIGSLASEFDAAVAEAMAERGHESGPGPPPPHEPWPNRHSTKAGQQWWRSESDVDSWP